MRRLLLILLMFVLPLQWSWAAAASVCGHEDEQAVAHLGHHEHEHQAPAVQPEPDPQDSKGSADHPDCKTCHGMGTPLVSAETAMSFAWHGAMRFPPYATVIPDRSPETLLRPPLELVS